MVAARRGRQSAAGRWSPGLGADRIARRIGKIRRDAEKAVVGRPWASDLSERASPFASELKQLVQLVDVKLSSTDDSDGLPPCGDRYRERDCHGDTHEHGKAPEELPVERDANGIRK